MAINLARRDAFSKAFRQYEAVLDSFVRRDVKIIRSDDAQPAFRPEWVKRILVMQFVVRLLKSRAKGGTQAINWFAFEATSRYISERQNLFGTAAITASDKYRAALTTYEQGLADTIFQALVAESSIECCKFSVPEDEQPEGQTVCGKSRDVKCPHEEFVEVDFWRDIFIALAGQNMHEYGRALHVIVLDHMAEFKDALDAAPDEVFVQ